MSSEQVNKVVRDGSKSIVTWTDMSQQEQDAREGRRSRASRLTSRVNFFEQVWLGRNRSPSSERTAAGDEPLTSSVTSLDADWSDSTVASSLRGGSDADDDQSDSTVSPSLRSGARYGTGSGAVAPVQPVENADSATVPWRMALRPVAGISKYQEWRQQRLSTQSQLQFTCVSDESQESLAPWRRRRATTQESPAALSEDASCGARKVSQPVWYAEYCGASLTQAANRSQPLRHGAVDTRYDVHIASIKGDVGSNWLYFFI